MTHDVIAAKQTILIHAGHLDVEGRSSIVASLRPFQGVKEEDFCEFFAALIALHEAISGPECVERDLVYALWDFCARLRILAIGASSSLRTNRIIDESLVARLTAWHDSVDSFCRRSFHQLTMLECMSNHLDYIASDICPSPLSYRSLLPLLIHLRGTADVEMSPIVDRALRAIETG
jgi:hypothetical protein